MLQNATGSCWYERYYFNLGKVFSASCSAQSYTYHVQTQALPTESGHGMLCHGNRMWGGHVYSQCSSHCESCNPWKMQDLLHIRWIEFLRMIVFWREAEWGWVLLMGFKSSVQPSNSILWCHAELLSTAHVSNPRTQISHYLASVHSRSSTVVLVDGSMTWKTDQRNTICIITRPQKNNYSRLAWWCVKTWRRF